MKLKKSALLFLLVFVACPAFSQVNVSGPSCVLPGIEYHYAIERQNHGVSNFQVCVTGGMIKDLTATCVTYSSSTILKIIWNNIASGSISVSPGSANQNLLVTITSDLAPGAIAANSLQQLIQQGSIPDTIRCSDALGGNCLPVFDYQWQRSNDKISWANIPNSNNKVLKLNFALNEPTYFRRRVTELGSGTIKYSDIASVYVTPR